MSAGKYTEEQIQRVRDIDIATMLGIKNTGRKIMLKCPNPNHNDSTPSFQLRPDNSFYCFGCGVGGRGWISFCMFMGHKFSDIMREFSSVDIKQ